MLWLICGVLLGLALALGGLVYWALKDFWQEMPGRHDLNDGSE
jgi:hypothetical protein